ncbi:MAG: hypothetical protein FWG78_00965 [Coriobacteriia bacterium]|nr:hypothetical protein [Coriobacteriia bacterium]
MASVRKALIAFYLTLGMAILLLPLVGLLWYETDTSEMPAPSEEVIFDLAYLAKLGDFFEENFAYRKEFLSLNGHMRYAVGVSATNQVIIGTNEWLFFVETLDDYLGRNLMSERQAYNIVHNLELTQSFVERHGAQFVATIAPNKNSVYGKYMPTRYRVVSDTSNIDLLEEHLAHTEVTYADLFAPLRAAAAEQNLSGLGIYYKRDTHWNNRGALIAYSTVLDTLDREHGRYESVNPRIEPVNVGDLDRMLLIENVDHEEGYVYHENLKLRYVDKTQDANSDYLVTANPAQTGSLLMYRDSFADMLVPFFAEEFERAVFTQYIPYNLEYDLLTGSFDYVVFQRAERSISLWQDNPPVFEGPTVEVALPAFNELSLTLDANDETATPTLTAVHTDGDYVVVDGILDPQLAQHPNVQIYIALEQQGDTVPRVYQPFYITATRDGLPSAYGFRLYLRKTSLEQNDTPFYVILEDSGKQSVVATGIISQEN